MFVLPDFARRGLGHRRDHLGRLGQAAFERSLVQFVCLFDEASIPFVVRIKVMTEAAIDENVGHSAPSDKELENDSTKSGRISCARIPSNPTFEQSQLISPLLLHVTRSAKRIGDAPRPETPLTDGLSGKS